MDSEGTLIVISAPSGGGKTSLVAALMKRMPQLTVSVSHTTRAPRVGEKEGVNYFFVTVDAFQQLKAQGEFLEEAQVFNHWYGTSKKWVMEQLRQGKDVILEIDWQGARRIKELLECVSIFILPPSREVLLNRLRARQQDSVDIITERMNKASNEIAHYVEYDYLVINDNFDIAVEELAAIIKSQRLKTAAQQRRYEELLASLVG